MLCRLSELAAEEGGIRGCGLDSSWQTIDVDAEAKAVYLIA